jgi:hypothetical protein
VPPWRDEREEASQHATAGMLRHELGGEHQESVSVTVVVAP